MYNINHLLFNIFYERVYDLWLTCFIYFVSLFNFHSYTNCSNFYFRGTVYVYRLHVYVSSTFLRCGSPSPYSSKYTNSVFWIQIKSNTNANSLQNFKLSMKVYAELETECEYNIQKIARVSGKVLVNYNTYFIFVYVSVCLTEDILWINVNYERYLPVFDRDA